jgi:hypothetical protein
MKICIVVAGANVHGRILADALARFSPTIFNEVGTERAEKLSKWLAPDYGPTLPRFLPLGDFRQAAVQEFDYAINGGCGIVREPQLSAPKRGWLNAHPGLLPEYRGADPVLWALRHGGPQGATIHLMDAEIDTGPILLRREFYGHRARTVLELRLCVIEFAAALLAEFLSAPEAYSPQPQDPREGATYSLFCGGDHAEAERRLGHLIQYENRKDFAS